MSRTSSGCQAFFDLSIFALKYQSPSVLPLTGRNRLKINTLFHRKLARRLRSRRFSELIIRLMDAVYTYARLTERIESSRLGDISYGRFNALFNSIRVNSL